MVQSAPGGQPAGAKPEGPILSPLPARTPLFSPLGYIIVFVIMLAEGALVYMIAGFLHSGGGIATTGEKITGAWTAVDKLDIDELEVGFDVTDPARPDAPPEQHALVIKPVLYFEKGKEGASDAIKNATVIKDKLRDVIRTMLTAKGYRPLKQPGVLDDMKLDIKDRLNQELKAQVVKEVVYSDVKWR